MHCGNCRHDHPTAADIRACYAARYAAEGRLTERFSARLTPDTPTTRETARRDEDAEWAASIREGRPVAAFFAQFTMPAGYYAVPSRTGNNDLDFYRVDRPEKGRWVGFVFVKRILGGHPPQWISKYEQTGALQRIMHAGPDEASVLFATKTGCCRACRIELTDDASRALGYGETCARKRGLGAEWKRLDRELNKAAKS